MTSPVAKRKKNHHTNDKLMKGLADISKQLENRQYSQAIASLDKMIRKNKSDPRPLALKSWAYETQGSFEQACRVCEVALKLAPEQPEYQLRYAKLLALTKKYEQAFKIVSAFLEVHPGNIEGLNVLSACYRGLDKKPEEFITLLIIAGVSQLNEYQRHSLFNLASRVRLSTFTKEIVRGFLAILDYQEAPVRSLSDNIRNYITLRYQLEQQQTVPNLVELSTDALLIKALPLVRPCSPEVEFFQCRIREALLVLMIQEQNINAAFIPLMRALALNYYLNEYVAYVKDIEKEMLEGAKQLLSIAVANEGWQPSHSETLLLMLAMYHSFYDLDCANILLQHPLETWPASLKEIAQESLFNIDQELKVAQTVKVLTKINDGISQQVREQYEQHPYPRWKKTNNTSVESSFRLVTASCPEVADTLPEEMKNPKTRVLIAGSGTGIQPINVARLLPQAEITAIDISRRSLAYSIIKANEMNIDNIDFFQADILELPEDLGRFFYMECCGVLHHMADPKQGWKKLVDHLEPGGVMAIALYSASARRAITSEREKIAQLKIEPSVDAIRLYRKAMLSQPKISPVASMFSDFYSMSECRDLLFHRQEICFTWPMIAEHCEALGLKFLGLINHAGNKEAFFDAFPQEKDTSSLQKLHEYECQYPFAFRSMYQFLVQKPLT